MSSLAPIRPPVKPVTAQAAYRAHLFSDCDRCAQARWCDILDRLDFLAALEDSSRG